MKLLSVIVGSLVVLAGEFFFWLAALRKAFTFQIALGYVYAVFSSLFEVF